VRRNYSGVGWRMTHQGERRGPHHDKERIESLEHRWGDFRGREGDGWYRVDSMAGAKAMDGRWRTLGKERL
jgi:hypothetical protein